MATETPDVRNLKSWKDAFQYPIPTVRKVEQELRRDIASNREKLRSLVGYVYTAHTALFGECILTSVL
jgi:conserved oligomeric Golgi complex subunit 1